jgi:heme-degrading monooxygenase HmoA
MILEAAVLSIAPAKRALFEAAFAQARLIIKDSPGFLRLELQRCREIEGRYLLLVRWREIEDHLVGFRQSPRFTQWRTLIGPYFNAPPDMHHYDEVGGEGGGEVGGEVGGEGGGEGTSPP